MPSMFTISYYHAAFGESIFVDSLGKEHSVFLARTDGRTYLTAGWFLMGSYYGLERGGYFRMAYVSFGRFFCQVFNNVGQEVYGPPGTLPPVIFTNAPTNPVIIPAASNSVEVATIDDSVVSVDEKSDFCHILTKVVTFLDLSRDGLVVLFVSLFFFCVLYGLACSNMGLFPANACSLL